MNRSAAYAATFFVLAPGSTAGLVPWLITGWHRPDVPVGAPDVAGWLLVGCGALAVVACFTRFVREGRGTPAPIAPTEVLVVGGLYRLVRNPMYVAVAAVIGGEALVFRSLGTTVWLAVFMATVWLFVKVYEEPVLAEQFGDSYERYRRAVPGWRPRLTPYRG